MKNFRILSGDEPEPDYIPHLYEPGTFIPYVQYDDEKPFVLTVRMA